MRHGNQLNRESERTGMEPSKDIFTDMVRLPGTNLQQKRQAADPQRRASDRSIFRINMPLSKYISANRAIWRISALIMPPAWQILLRSFGAKPFLTDCNTLYSGRRSNAVDHLQSAMENGFNPISAQCQVIIADGLKGTDYREIPIDGEYCPAPKIGTAIADADIIISMNHFKGHEQAGFGGALKNLGMGCASVGGKLELHASSQPKLPPKIVSDAIFA